MAADDWIKMRGALLDHPKVIAMTRRLLANADFRDWLTPGGGGQINGEIVSRAASRCVTVALVMCVWSTARSHGKFDGDDLHLPHSALDDLDEFANAPGLGEAMREVGWAEVRKGKQGIFLPRFKEFNVPMTEAERSKNYRARQSQGVTPAATRTSRNHRDENGRNVTTRVRVRSTTTPALDSTTVARASTTPVEKAGTATPPASAARTEAPAAAGLDPGLAPIPAAVREAITRSARSDAGHSPTKRGGRVPRVNPPAPAPQAPEVVDAPPGAQLERGPNGQAHVEVENEIPIGKWWLNPAEVVRRGSELGQDVVDGEDFEDYTAKVLVATGEAHQVLGMLTEDMRERVDRVRR